MENFFYSLFKDYWDSDIDEDDNSKFNINNPLKIIDINDSSIINIPGLYNFEGNCYLNSILQCFYYCNDLTNYFLNNKIEIEKKDGKLSNAYLNLILRLNNKEKYNDAKVFLNALKEVSNNFFKRGGNDPKAVLFYLLESIHDELKEQNIYYIEKDICCEDINQEKAFQKCKQNEENNKSIISELFNWCLITENECKKCGNNHYICEYKNNILIELNKYKTQDKIIQLDDLIKFYFQDTEEYFICNTDSEIFKVIFTKKMISLPQYLIIILNRNIIKFNVKYNDCIDLSKYCVNDNNAKYNFIGATLTNDYENKKGTHAISRCRTSEGTYIFNDLDIINDYNDINNYNPYILFYKKIINN